jgi:hypothetical protein
MKRSGLTYQQIGNVMGWTKHNTETNWRRLRIYASRYPMIAEAVGDLTV